MNAPTTVVGATSRDLFLAFAKIGLTSFGGGLSGWMLREFVHARHWLSEEEFLTGLALAQAFPGVNVVNLAIWIGYRLRGTAGVLASLAGILVPPGVLILGVAAGFRALSSYQLSRLALDGVAAAAIGLSLSTGVVAARRAARGVVPALVMAAAFAGVALLKLPPMLVVVVLAPVSVGVAYARSGRA